MTVVRNTSITDQNHLVTYSDANGILQTIARSIEVRIFAPDAPGTYPTILYSHGLGGSPFANAGNVARDLAALGYIVVAPTHLDSLRTPSDIQDDFANQIGLAAIHRVADMQFLLSHAAAMASGLVGYSADIADPTIAGHSLGAFTAQLLTGVSSNLVELAGLAPGNSYGLTAVADARFKQAILLSPQGIAPSFGLTSESWNNQKVPAITITGTQDNGFDGQDYHDRLTGFDSSPGLGKHAVVFTGADHSQIGGGQSNPLLNAEVTAAASLFLEAYVGNSSSAFDMLNDLTPYQAAHPLVSEVYTRDGIKAEGLLAAGSGGLNLLGLSTDDVMTGGSGNDTLVGGFGNDTFVGGLGNDIMTGGSGRDLYRYTGSGNMGDDAIADFNALLDIPNRQYPRGCAPHFRDADAAASQQQDRIDLRETGYGAASLGTDIAIATVNGNTVISFQAGVLAGTTITLMGVAAASINAGDFFF
jgi:dienelactone hydrolase